MELLVLSALKWRLRSVMPFTFINFFAYKADPNDIEFLDHCPSSMAAAAIICVAGETLNLDLINPVSAITWCIGLTKYAGSSWDELKHIRQAVGFLVIFQRYRISYDEIVNDLCPVSGVLQLYRICTQYWDDKYNTQSVSSSVL